jgi:hypothetical protein
MWGEHRHEFKLAPYEESIRVPFVIRFDRMIGNPRIDRHLVLNLDLAPTFADAGGVRAPGAEGRSLLPLLDGDRERFAGWYRDRRRDELPATEIERRLEEVRFPERMPSFSSVVVDPLGDLWLERYRSDLDSGQATWYILDPDLRWVDSVTTPPDFTVYQVGTDFLLGVRLEDVPYVELYPILGRGARGSQ